MQEQYFNPTSKRRNVFKDVYDNPAFKDVLVGRDKLPQFPFLVDIEVTNFCNLECIFCGQRIMTRARGYMTDKIFRKVVDECEKHNTPIRLIRWGEPFLHPDIISFIAYIKNEKNIPLHISTNGLSINEAQLDKIVELSLDSILFSFQGVTKKEYEKMRNNNRYDELESNIKKLIAIRGDKLKPYIHISTSVTNESESEINNFMSYWGNIVDSVSAGKTNLSRIYSLQENTNKKLNDIEALLGGETLEKVYLPCKEIYQKLSVNYDGSVSACSTDFNNYMIVGDLNENSLKEIWNRSERLKAYRILLDNMQHNGLTLCRVCYPRYKTL